MTTSPNITIGIVSYKDTKYLEHAIPTLLTQSYKNYQIIICDNNPDLSTTRWVEENYPDIKVISAGGNVGFGKAHNKMITEAINQNSKYYLAYNSDIFASKNLIKNLVNEFEKTSKNQKVAGINPKLLIWQNFPSNPSEIKENKIDTTGILATRRHYFEERGNNQIDQNPFKDKKNVWGLSGACPIISIQALKNIQYSKGEFFDANFFMYKEDIDLSYRFRWAGYDIVYCHEAIAWHDRTGTNPGNPIKQILERRNRPQYIQEQSFLNQIQLLQKNWSKKYSITTKLLTLYEHLKICIYLLIFNRNILKKLKQIPKNKEKTTPKKISPQKMEKFLSNKFQ